MSTNKFKDIKFDENLIAQVYDTNSIDNTIFPTPASNEMQFGVGIAAEDKTLKTHIHKVVKREIFNTSEFLFVISGLMTIEIYLAYFYLNNRSMKKNKKLFYYNLS